MEQKTRHVHQCIKFKCMQIIPCILEGKKHRNEFVTMKKCAGYNGVKSMGEKNRGLGTEEAGS